MLLRGLNAILVSYAFRAEDVEWLVAVVFSGDVTVMETMRLGRGHRGEG